MRRGNQESADQDEEKEGGTIHQREFNGGTDRDERFVNNVDGRARGEGETRERDIEEKAEDGDQTRAC